MGERLKNYVKTMERMLERLEQCKENVDQEPMEGVPDGQMVRNTGILQAAQTPQIQERRVQLQRAKDELLVQIGFFQHERLIHLIVTALFALLAMIVLVWVTVDFMPESALLLGLLLVLLIPYIRHYYILENGTQKLYRYYDRLEKLLGECIEGMEK